MKKLLASFVVLIFFVPCVSFAQTTPATTYSPQYIALLEQLLSVLENELAALQSQQPVATSTPSGQVSNSAPQFSGDMQSVYSDCDSGTELYRCEADETAIQSVLETQAENGFSSSDESSESSALTTEISKLTTDSSSTFAASASYIEAIDNNFSTEANMLQQDLAIITNTQATANPAPCIGFSGQGLVNGVMMEYACGFPTVPVPEPKCTLQQDLESNHTYCDNSVEGGG